MKRSNGKDLPKAREKDLVTRQIPGELLVYDLKRHKAFCLNDTAAAVWKGCNGRRDVNQLAQLLTDDRKSAIDEKVVWLALDQLEKSNLLREKVVRPVGLPQVSRRDLIRMGIVTAVTLPLITMMASPAAAQAGGSVITTTQCNARVQPNCNSNPCTNGKSCLPQGLNACLCQ